MRKFILISYLLFCSIQGEAQVDSTLFKRVEKDSSSSKLNMDALYNRPFLKMNKIPVSLGGYFETRYRHVSTDGVSDGHEFHFQRMSLFVASSVGKRIKFLSEIELENDKDEQLEGGNLELGIEFAALDIELHPMLNFRGGIVLNPIGAFNQNHDGPKWEFSDRPLAMTNLLPATFSNPGFGLYGKHYQEQWMLGYEVYLTNGLDGSILDNEEGKTYLPAVKENAARFSTSTSGHPLTTAKIAIRNSRVGELGISYMGGVYNKTEQEGLVIDSKRRCDVYDLDFNTTITKSKTNIIAEWVWIFVQRPANYFEAFGGKQQGGYVDIIQPLLRKRIFSWEKASVQLALRGEYVDWNVGQFKDGSGTKADHVWSVLPGISFRPIPQTVLRFQYRWMKQWDVMGNGPARTGGFTFGLSSYF